MKKMCIKFALYGICFFLLSLTGHAGELESPADPFDPASAMFSQEDLYLRMTTGAQGAKRTGAFTEPAAGPGDTGHTMDEIMEVSPSLDNIDGALPDDVAEGKTFWGLTEGHWGLQTGTAGLDPAGIYPAQVPDTGQNSCFDRTGAVIDCTGSGQDGDQYTGIPLPSPRFTDNGDGTVKDNLTGLIWLKNANCSGFRTWEQALADAAALQDGECGLTDGSIAGDWRMPNLFELESLRNMNYFDPPLSDANGTEHWVDGDPFINVQIAPYWSSTTFANSTASAACVIFSNGNENATGKSSTSYAWPVRGGK
ncbi:MAG: DUF1566 domain-containing protein [Desulfobulbaceae bacterium]|nr:DUF1566 domain-containing protein [Desulfobulbaceae bacterium]